MRDSYHKLQKNINRVRQLGGLYESIRLLTTSALDPSDILRAQIVLLVGALDAYIHDITRVGMLQISNGEREMTTKFGNFMITTSCLTNFKEGASFDDCFEYEIRKRHGYKSFQNSEKISDAINIFYKYNIWKMWLSL